MRALVTAIVVLTVLVGAACGGNSPSAEGSATGPSILSLTGDRSAMTEGQTLKLVATVTDPDGVGDVLGGTLLDPSTSTTYGAFSPYGQGTFQIELSWEGIHDVVPIEFADEQQRSFLARFVDSTGRV